MTRRILAAALVIILIAIVGCRLGRQAQPTGVGVMAEPKSYTHLGPLDVTAPTAQPTYYPALVVDQQGTGRVVELRDSSTPVVYLNNNGSLVRYVPTAQATAVPGLIIDSAAASNPLEVRKAATPVVQVSSAGAITAASLDVSGAVNFGASNLYPIGYASDGWAIVAGTTTISNTKTIAHGLSSVTAAFCTMSTDPSNAEECHCTANVSGTTVTLKVWKEDLPSPGDSDVTVSYLIFGQK